MMPTKPRRKKRALWLYLFILPVLICGAAGYLLHQIPLLTQNPAATVINQNAVWYLSLVNRYNPIPEDAAPNLADCGEGALVDRRIAPALQRMLKAMRADGLTPKITSAYRTAEEQTALMEEKISDFVNEGYSPAEAKRQAKRWVAAPGTSEHQIGLAVDLSTANAAEQPAETVWRWLAEHSYQYGFILRYPENKESITGVAYEPWHVRYVGKEAAEYIFHSGLCLEEYLYAHE